MIRCACICDAGRRACGDIRDIGSPSQSFISLGFFFLLGLLLSFFLFLFFRLGRFFFGSDHLSRFLYVDGVADAALLGKTVGDGYGNCIGAFGIDINVVCFLNGCRQLSGRRGDIADVVGIAEGGTEVYGNFLALEDDLRFLFSGHLDRRFFHIGSSGRTGIFCIRS